MLGTEKQYTVLLKAWALGSECLSLTSGSTFDSCITFDNLISLVYNFFIGKRVIIRTE